MFPLCPCVCVWILPPLSISCPPCLLSSSSCNKQHEGGYNWEVQCSARWNHLYLNAGFRSLSRSLLYIVSLPLFPSLYTLCFSLTFSPSVSHALSHYVYSSVSVINMMRLSFYFSKIPHSCSFHCFFFSGSHPLSIYYNTAPDPHYHPQLSSKRNFPSVDIRRRSSFLQFPLLPSPLFPPSQSGFCFHQVILNQF